MWTIFKVFTEFVNNITPALRFVFLGCEACGILARWLGIKPTPFKSEGEGLATGLLGKSQGDLTVSAMKESKNPTFQRNKGMLQWMCKWRQNQHLPFGGGDSGHLVL